MQTATIVDAPALSDGVSADPEDDKFLACAIAAAVPTIVSGDKHLLRLNGWAGLAIVTPRRFLEGYLDSDADAPALSDGVSADPEDDKFLACAIAADILLVATTVHRSTPAT